MYVVFFVKLSERNEKDLCNLLATKNIIGQQRSSAKYRVRVLQFVRGLADSGE